MRTSATVRIIIYSLVILLLVGILCVSLNPTALLYFTSGSYTTGEGSVDAADVTALQIEWAAGSIEIVTADTDKITFSESGRAGEKQQMVYSLNGGVLHIRYSSTTVILGFGSNPIKDLTITVPESWICRDLEIDGASLDVTVDGLNLGQLEVDGASNRIRFDGSVTSAEIDGASNSITLISAVPVKSVDLDGASCELDLTLPADCGFRASVEGLSCDFRSDLPYTKENGSQVYGDEYCKISADGLSCEVTVNAAE